MRNFITLGVAFLTMIMLTRCVEKTNEPIPVPPIGTMTVADTVFFRVGEKVLVLPDNLEMGFERVVSDNRCPLDAPCRFPGAGVIRLWIKKPGLDTIFVNIGLLGIDHAVSESQLIPADTLGRRFSLIALYPLPVSYAPVPQENYLAGVEIKKFECRFSTAGSVIITDQPPDSIELDPFHLYSVQTAGDSLKIHVRYSGGCEKHSFQLYMTPPSFSDDYPYSDLLQARLYLRHDAAGDACEAYISRNLYFDIRPIAWLYEDTYGLRDTIVVSVFCYRTHYNQKKSDLYFPGN